MTVENQSPEQSTTAACSSWGRVGIFLSLIGMIVLVTGFTYGYFAIAKVNMMLAKTVSELQTRTSTQTTDLTAMQQSVASLQAFAQKSQDIFTQQEQTMADWRSAQKGDLDKWHAAEAQYLVKLANDHLQFSYNVDMAIELLTRAEQSLQNAQDASLLEIRKAIASDISRLQLLPKVDVTQLYLRLSGINNQIEQLALPVSPLNNASMPAETAPAQDQSWWRAGLDRSWQALQKIVIVRYNGSNSLPLILPEEKAFLYQNLHAQLENALWAVLHRNASVYQTALTRASDWIRKYFVQNEAAQAMLKQLQELQAANIKPSDANLAATLALFDNVAPQPASSEKAT